MAWNINLTVRVILENAPNSEHSINQKLDYIIMKLNEYLTKQGEFNTQQREGLASVSESVADLSGDIDTLNEKITELQNSPDRVTEEDQRRIDALEAEGTELAGKATTIKEALKTLAAKTPPKPPVEEPPVDPPVDPQARRR